MGTFTGLGAIDGVGAAITLVKASDTSPRQSVSPSAAPSEALRPDKIAPDQPTSQANSESSLPTEDKANSESKDQSEISENPTEENTSSATPTVVGMFGQSGETDTDLWNAIAPCWNRIADTNTLGATLTLSFSSTGALSAPPVIERDPSATITDQSLQAEAEAIQALTECGAYPMAKDLQNVTVSFSPPGHEIAPFQNLTPTSVAIQQ